MKKLQTKDAAKLLDVSVARIHQLEREGTLRADKTVSGWRIFDEAEVKRVKAERAAKKK